MGKIQNKGEIWHIYSLICGQDCQVVKRHFICTFALYSGKKKNCSLKWMLQLYDCIYVKMTLYSEEERLGVKIGTVDIFVAPLHVCASVLVLYHCL